MSHKNQPLYPWINFYADGVPAEINPDAFPSIAHLLEESVKKKW